MEGDERARLELADGSEGRVELDAGERKDIEKVAID